MPPQVGPASCRGFSPHGTNGEEQGESGHLGADLGVDSRGTGNRAHVSALLFVSPTP